MQTGRTGSQLKPAGRIFAALLAGWIFVLSLAAVSPALHEWMHADNGCASHCEHPDEGKSDESSEHFCAVLILQSGAIATVALEVPALSDYERISVVIGDEIIVPNKAAYRQKARAPPVKVIA